MRVNYRSKTNINNKIFGYFFAIMGVIPIIIMISIIVLVNVGDSKIPDDAKWYTGWIKEVTHMESRYEWEEDSDGDEYRVKVYDCEAILEYEVDAQSYLYKYSVTGRNKPLQEGEFFYVKVSPNNPDKVYKISNTKSNVGIYLGAAVFGVVGIIFVIIGLSTVRSGSKKEKAMNNSSFESQMNPGMMNNTTNMANFNQGYNVEQPYNGGQVYSNVEYNNQEYNNYDYYNNNQGTNYSGTSLRD